MKVLIKDLATARYADGNGAWTHVPEGAFNFASTDAAIDFVLSNALCGSPVALCLRGPEDMIEYRLPGNPATLVDLVRRARMSDIWHGDEMCA